MLEFFNTLNELKEKTRNNFVQTDKKPSNEIKEIYEKVTNLLAAFLIESNKGVGKGPAGYVHSPFGEDEDTDEERFDKVRKGVCLAGGSLSELFIEEYKGIPNDLDIFIDYHKFAYSSPVNTVDIIVEVLNKDFGTFNVKERKEWENQNYDKSFKLREIVTGTFTEFPEIKIELIFVYHFNLMFDLSFREFYYKGNYIVATERALKDIQNKTITFNTAESPLSALIRAEEFAKRYDYSIDEYSKNWIKKYIKYYYTSDEAGENAEDSFNEKISKTFNKIEKYKENFNFEQLLKELQVIKIAKEEKSILGKIYCETYEMNVEVFRNAIERMKIIEEKKVDTNKYYEVAIPKLTSKVNKFIDQTTQKEVSKEIEIEINELIKKHDKKMALKSVFASEEEMNYIKRNANYKFSSHISKCFNVYLNKSDSFERFYKVVEKTIIEGKLDLENTKFDFVDDETDGFYYGKPTTLETNILSEKMYLKPTFVEYFFKHNTSNNNEIDFKYSESEEEIGKVFNYDKNENRIYVGGQNFGYLINERRDFLLNLFNNGIVPLSDDVSTKSFAEICVSKETNDILFIENFLSKESIQIINRPVVQTKQQVFNGYQVQPVFANYPSYPVPPSPTIQPSYPMSASISTVTIDDDGDDLPF